MFYSIFHGNAVIFWSVNLHFPTLFIHFPCIYLLRYIFTELRMTSIFKRLPARVGGTSGAWLSGSGTGVFTAKTNQKADEIQVSKTPEKRHPLLSSIWCFFDFFFLKLIYQKTPPRVIQPTTSQWGHSANLHVHVWVQLQAQHSSLQPISGSHTDVQWAGSQNPTQLLSTPTALTFSTDCLPKLIVAIRLKKAVSQPQCL